MYLPSVAEHGGTRVGNSYLTLFVSCPRKWYFQYLYPSEDASGIVPIHTDGNLLKGSTFHEGLAAWLASGCRDGEDTGEYVLDRALEVAREHHDARLREWSDQSDATTAWQSMQEMLVRYHEWYGPGGRKPDYPDMQVMCDSKTGIPLIEQEVTIPLGGSYFFTCRVDAVVERFGYACILEHKTSVGSYVHTRLSTIHTDSQFTGEVAALRHMLGNEAVSGVYCNVIIKNRSANSKFDCAVREMTDRTVAETDRFKVKCENILNKIDYAVEGFHDAQAKGVMTMEEAADVFFPEYGMNTEYCHAYRRQCEYLSFCRGIQSPDVTLINFRPRTKLETTEQREASK